MFYYSEFDGLKRLISVKNKIENKEKLTLLDMHNLIFIPLMGNVNRVDEAFEVFHIANTPNLFSDDELENIKKCQYVVAYIIADGNDECSGNFWEVIKLNNEMIMRYEQKLIDQNTKEVTGDLARKLKDVLSDEVIAEKTSLPLNVVKNL